MKKLSILLTLLIALCTVFMLASCSVGNSSSSESGENNDENNGTPPVVECTSVTLSQTSLSLKVGDEADISATCTPSDVTDPTVNWSSSVPTVAKYDNGKIVALSQGSCTITAQCGDRKAECLVTVENKTFVESVRFDKTDYLVNINYQLKLVPIETPASADDRSYEISLSNEGIISAVKVDDGILVYALAAGSSELTVTYTNGATASANITVMDPQNLITLNLKQALPVEVKNINSSNYCISKSNINSVEYSVLVADETSLYVTVTIKFTKTYDASEHGRVSATFNANVYDDSNALIASSPISDPFSTLNNQSTSSFSFNVPSDLETVEEITLEFTDWKE